MIIDRDKHNKYVVGWKPNYTVPTNQSSSSGTNVTIVYGGGGSGSSTPVSSEAFSYYKVSDGENAITQEAKVQKDIANLSIIGDEGIKVELITDPTIFEASFTSTGINEGVYKISYGKVTTVVEQPTESETQAEEPTEPEVVITFPMTITYVSGEKIKAEQFDTLRLLNDKEEVATYPSSGLAIEGDADGILSISLEVYKEVQSVDEEGKPVQDAEGNPVMEKQGLYFNRILLTSQLEDQPSTQAEGDSTEEEPQQPTYEPLLSFDVVVNIDTVIKLSSDSGAGLWKLDDNGNIYTEYNAYSLKELSAYGPGEGEAGEGVGFLHELGDVSIPAPNEIPDNAILQYNIETGKWEAVEWSELDDTATREWVEQKFKNLINGAPADLDTLGEIAIVIQELQQLLDWFSFVDGRIRANYDFWGIGEISAYGPASGSDPGTGGGAGYLHELGDVTINNDTLTDGQIIVWDEDSQMWVNVDFSGLDEGALALYLTQNKYATQGWVNSQLDPINNKLEEFQTTIDMINDMFEWDNGKIKAKATLYSIGEISAYGAGGGSSSTEGYLHELGDVLLTDLQDDQLLMYEATIGKWINVDKNSVGLNETELEQYLTTHKYVTSSQVVPPTRRIIAGTGLTGGGALSSDVTLSLATSGVTSGVYTKVTVDQYGRVTLGALLVENDIPNIAWSKIHSTPTTLAGYGITDAYTMQQSDERYVNVTGDIMTGNLILPTLQANTSIILGSVKLEYDSASNALKISNVNTQQVINLYATGEISAYGYNDGSSSTGGYLHELEDVTLSNPQNGQALVYNSSTGQWVNTTIQTGGIDEAALAAYLTDNRYATQQWVTSQNYLTAVSVDTISDLHSSWDAVLKAQKPAWLTTVSLATISDLHASWDALLKAAPTDYVTRWPGVSEVTGLQDALNLKLDAATFNDLFEKVEISTGVYAIRAKYGLYSNDWISAKGANPDAGGTVSGATGLDGLSDVTLTNMQNGQVLMYNGSQWVNSTLDVGLDETALAQYLTDNGYVTQGWATSQFAYKTGTNATGTWPISVTSEAGWLDSHDTRDVNNTPGQFQSGARFEFKKNSTDGLNDGITYHGILHFRPYGSTTDFSGGPSHQLGFTYNGNLWMRTSASPTAWGFWRKILDTTNYTSTLDSRYLRTVNLATISDLHSSWDALLKAAPSVYVTRWPTAAEVGALTQTTADGRYVNVSGDTMTGNLTLKPLGGPWLKGKVQAPIMTNGDSSTTGNTYHPIIWGKTEAGDVWNLGHGASDQVGFFGFYSERTANGTDWSTYIKVSTGVFYQSKAMNVTGLITATAGLTTPQYIQIGSGRIKWDSSNNALYVEKSDGTAIGFYSKGFISAKGANDDAGGTVSGVTKLSDLSDVQLGTLATNQVLSWNGSKWVNKTLDMGLDETALAQYLTNNQYLTMPTGDGRYALKGGSNATGTWPISITGNAATATKLAIQDNRSVNTAPFAYGKGLVYLFKYNTADGLSDGGTYHSVLQFDQWAESSGGRCKQLALTDGGNMWFRTASSATAWGSWKKLLDSSNYATTLDTRYVKKAGDTMTGTLVINKSGGAGASPLVVGGSATNIGLNDLTSMLQIVAGSGGATNSCGIGFHNPGICSAVLGYYNTNSNNGYFNFKSDDTSWEVRINNNKVWHAGNDGSGSGLDADTVDSLHAIAFARADQSPAGDLNTVNGKGIMSNPANANATTARHYPIQEAGTLFYGTAAYNSANQIYGTYSSNRWFFRGGGGSTASKTAWKEMAFLTSNVASASKLQTSQKIWGQPFDGTAPVSGNMTGVGSFTGVGQFKYGSNDESSATYGKYHRLNLGYHKIDHTDFYEQVFNFYSNGGGTTWAKIGSTNYFNGNVGIGTTSPSYKLHVAGTGYFSRTTIFGSTITVDSSIYTNTGWFQNNKSDTGLYNNAVDARWYATSNGWISDKKINAAAGLAVTGAATFSSTLTASGKIRTSNVFSAGEYRDDTYGYYNCTRPNTSGTFSCYAFVRQGMYAFGLGYNSSNQIVLGSATGSKGINPWIYITSSGTYTDGYLSAKGQNTSSDIRLKNILCPVKPSLKAFAKAPLFRFAWKSDPDMVEIGSSAQYWKNVLPDTVKERDGWLEMGYGNIALAGVITIARDFETLEQRVDRLEKENGKLKKKIKELERRAI